MKEADWQKRNGMKEGFSRVLANYTQLRRERKSDGVKLPKTRIVVALTQADHEVFALTTLKQRWIDAYIGNNEANLRHLASISGPTSYLASARAISDYIRHELSHSPDHEIRELVGQLEVDNEKPWFIPVTTMGKRPSEMPAPPISAHVELPLLLALCDENNVLM
jgi:hypothetical protein